MASTVDTLLTEEEVITDLTARGLHRFIPHLLAAWKKNTGLPREYLATLEAEENTQIEIEQLKHMIDRNITDLKRLIGISPAVDYVGSLIGHVAEPDVES